MSTHEEVRAGVDRSTETEPMPGRLHHEGANYASDAVITRETTDGQLQILLVRRNNGRWALPGGFRDALNVGGELESPDIAMFRELKEETSLTGLENQSRVVVYEGVVEDERNEGTPGELGSRWIETTAYHIDVTGLPGMEPMPSNEIQETKWEVITEELLESLNANHGEIVRDAIHEKIDRKAPEIIEALTHAAIYKKQGQVEARHAEVGESITTRLASGKVEVSKNEANEGDWVVTNPNGEKYLISNDKFQARYQETEEVGVYRAKGYVRAIANPYGKRIRIMAEWGSMQYGDEDCFIADVCDEMGNLSREPYLIERAAFEETYSMF